MTRNWRGRPPVSYEAVVSLIAATATRAGLAIQSSLDGTDCPKGVKVTGREMESLSMRRSGFHGEWNRTMLPRQ